MPKLARTATAGSTTRLDQCGAVALWVIGILVLKFGCGRITPSRYGSEPKA